MRKGHTPLTRMRLLHEGLLILLLAPFASCCAQFFDAGCQYSTERREPPQNTSTSTVLACPKRHFTKGEVLWAADPSGRLDVAFTLQDALCGIDCYYLELYVHENVSEEACNNSHDPNQSTPHSKKRYATRASCPADEPCQELCGKMGKVTFHYVFTGCYQLVALPKVKTNSLMRIYSWGKYIHTNYTMKRLQPPNVTVQHYGASGKTYVTIAFAPFLYSHPHTSLIKLRENIDVLQEGACYKTGRDHSMCSVKNTECQCLESSNKQTPVINCSLDNTTIDVSFKGLPEGYYCLFMTVIEDRCQEGTIWTIDRSKEPCYWQHSFNITKEDNPKVEEPDHSRFYIIMGIVCAIVFAAVVIALLALRSYMASQQRRSMFPAVAVVGNSAHSQIPLECPRILLLYARDCAPFMDLMATLREVLEDLAKCEVVDCLDASRWNEIGRSPAEWVRCLIEHPETRVVLVGTQCAHLRQQALNRGISTHYKEPDNHDNLFIYALKTLTDYLSPEIYRKVCVVRFEGFSDDKNLYGHLTPYMRFVLPSHLPQLISKLRPSAIQDPHEHLAESKEIQKLTQDLTQVINYKNRNINYLQDMLSIQRNEDS